MPQTSRHVLGQNPVHTSRDHGFACHRNPTESPSHERRGGSFDAIRGHHKTEDSTDDSQGDDS